MRWNAWMWKWPKPKWLAEHHTEHRPTAPAGHSNPACRCDGTPGCGNGQSRNGWLNTTRNTAPPHRKKHAGRLGSRLCSEAESFSGVPEQRSKTCPIKAQSTAIARAMARICNAERVRFGVVSGHERKTLSLLLHRHHPARTVPTSPTQRSVSPKGSLTPPAPPTEHPTG